MTMKQRRTIILFSLFLMLFTIVYFIPNVEAAKNCPTDDSYICSLYPTTNYGNSEYLYVANSGGVVANVYFKFSDVDTSGATVIFYFTVGSTLGNTFVLEIWTCSNTWTESAVTWNNKPTLTTKMFTLTISEFHQYSIDITSYITGNVMSLAIICQYTGSSIQLCQIMSKETSYTSDRPYITTPSASSPIDWNLIIPIIVICIAAILIVVIVLLYQRSRRPQTTSSVASTQFTTSPPATIAPPPPTPAVMPMQRFCIFCGSELEQDATFCTHCGKQQRS
jgi:hypothetical protein